MADKRVDIILRCSECKHENYITTKNKKAHPERFATNKFCPNCRKMTRHEEKK
ncbi:MAG TPA: 50S ribosomal protein L33 [Candidatus Enterosoma merdigallinarum]|nr:50S ribosomal protein L33 [Candidatus Enterosoma merdigallinarum]